MTECEQSGNGAERVKTRVERSGVVSGSQKNRAERSVSGEPWSGNGAVSGGQKNQVYRGAAKSSAPLTCSDLKQRDRHGSCTFR